MTPVLTAMTSGLNALMPKFMSGATIISGWATTAGTAVKNLMSGFTTGSKTVDGSLDAAYSAMVMAFSAEFGAEPTSSRADGARPTARWRLSDGSTVVATSESAPAGRIRVSAQHEKLPGPDSGDAAKQRLQGALSRLGD